MVYDRDFGGVGSRDQVSWNNATAQSQAVHNLQQKATKFYLQGHKRQWYFSLKALRLNINHDLTDKERTKLDEIETSCEEYLISLRSYESLRNLGQPEKITKDIKKDIGALNEKIWIYHISLMDFMKKLGFYPSKDNTYELKF